MARPQKEGLDYFPLDTDMDQDDKVALIEAKHGLEGFAIVIKLLMKIYKNGYYYQWTEKEQLLFSKRVNVDINLVNVIIIDCLKWKLFDEEIYEKYKVLTSKGIQKRYLEATSRRKKVQIFDEYCLVNVNDYKNLANVNINGVIVDKNTTKKRKEKESKVNKTTTTSDSKKEVATTSDLPVDENVQKLYRSYQQCGFGSLNFQVKELILGLLNEYSVEWIEEAFKVSVKQNNRSLSYAEGILRNWRRNGGMKVNKDEAVKEPKKVGPLKLVINRTI